MKFTYHSVDLNKDVELYIDDGLAKIISLYAERRKKGNNDNLVIIGGDTGTGKTNCAALMCAYYSYITNIYYGLDCIYFDPNKMVSKAIRTESSIFHFDEALFGGMAADWQTKAQKKLIKMLMLCRKKKHFFVFCMPEPLKLKDYLILERSIGMIRTYLRDGVAIGRFAYYRKKSKEILYNVWKKTGIKGYNKYYSFRGTFPEALPKIMDDIKYNINKDEAILTLDDGDKEVNDANTTRLLALREKICNLPQKLDITQKKLCAALDITEKTMTRWKRSIKTGQLYIENEVLEGQDKAKLSNSSGSQEENLMDVVDDEEKEEP